MLSTRQARSACECRRRSLGVEAKRSRAARAEAARAGRWWPWLDSNGLTFFVQQCDDHRGTWYVARVVSVSYFMQNM